MEVQQTDPIAQEKIFGPVLSVIRFGTLEEAMDLANSACYGLAAYVWSSRLEKGFRLANGLRTTVTMVSAGALAGEGAAHAFSGEPFGSSGVGVEGRLAGLEIYTRR